MKKNPKSYVSKARFRESECLRVRLRRATRHSQACFVFFLLFHQAGGTTLNADWPCQILRAEAWKAEQNFRSPRTY